MKRSYIPQLDGLRAIAIAAVLAFHFSYGVVRGGFLGVDLFFVLSGFLITSLLVEEAEQFGAINFRLFYFRRFLRLYPALLVLVGFTGLLWRFLPPSDIPFSKLAAASLFYYANLLSGHNPLSHVWSLSMEEQFYILWPILLALALRLKRWNLSLPIVVFVAAACVRIAMTLHHYSVGQIYIFPLARMDALACGGLVALLLARKGAASRLIHGYPVALKVIQLVSLGATFVLFCVLLGSGLQWWTYSVTSLLFAALITSTAVLQPGASWANRVLSSGPAVYVGRRSYGIYLYHLPVFLLSEPLRVHHSVSNFLFVSALRIALSILIAEASYRIVERPFLALKSRFTASARSVPVTAS